MMDKNNGTLEKHCYCLLFAAIYLQSWLSLECFFKLMLIEG